MATPNYKPLLNSSENLKALLAEQNAEGITSAVFSGNEPIDVLSAKTIFNAAKSAEDIAGISSITAPSNTPLTLSGGSLGASLVLGSGVSASTLLTVPTWPQFQISNTGGAGHSGLQIFQTVTGASGGEEATVDFNAKDAGNTNYQLGSISGIWASATAGSARSQIRIHANKVGGGSNSDFRLTGDGGIEFFGTSDTSWPGASIVRATNGTFQVSGTGIAGAAALWNNANRLFIGGDTGGVFFQNAANSATNLTLTDAGAASLRAGFTATSFTVSGGSIAALTMRSASNYLVFQGGTAGYLFQNTDNTGTLLGITNAGAATFAGAVTIGNTVNTVSPTSPNRTITMVVNGVTLYIAAKTTND